MKERIYRAKWRSARAEERYREKEAAGWNNATTTPPKSIDVDTDYGPTRAYRWPGTGPPVVFLHGVGDSSVRWVPFAEALNGHDVYAVDIMGDVGQSKPETGFTSADDYPVWLGQTLDGLGLTKPHVVGHSFGGYIALSYARETDRVASTTGFDPVGVVDLKLIGFMRWGFSVMLASFAPGPIRRWMAGRLRQPLLNDKAAVRLQARAQRDHPFKLPPLPAFTDDQLASIATPVCVVAGAESTVFDVEKLIDRITTTIPGAEARLLPEAGHALTLSHFDDCLAVVRDALAAPSVE